MPKEKNKPDKSKYENARITNILVNHWEDIKANKEFPSENDLNPAVLEAILDNCFLLNVEGVNEGKYNYKFLGKNVMNAYGSDLTKRADYEKGNPLSYKDKIKTIIQTKTPVTYEGEFTNINGNLVKYRLCLLPLGQNGIIESVLGGMKFKIIP